MQVTVILSWLHDKTHCVLLSGGHFFRTSMANKYVEAFAQCLWSSLRIGKFLPSTLIASCVGSHVTVSSYTLSDVDSFLDKLSQLSGEEVREVNRWMHAPGASSTMSCRFVCACESSPKKHC